jgi:hypothetical protein
MRSLRAFIHDHRLLAVLLVVLALAMRAAMPAGTMLGQHGKVLTIEICADASGAKLTRQIVVPHAGKPATTEAAEGKTAGSCAFSSLSMASLAGADAVPLVFILALGFAPVRAAPPRRVLDLRPPLRGPPALA